MESLQSASWKGMRDMEAIAKFLWEIFVMEIYGKHYSLVLFSLLENALIKAVIRCSIAAANILEAPEPGSNEQTTTFAPLFRFIFSSA